MKPFIIEEDHPFAIIVPLIEEGKLDPWKVDIVELANLYIEELRKREILDLRIPAKAVVAASFLLRKKVEVLFPKPERRRERRNYTLQEIVEMFDEESRDVEEALVDNLEKIRKIFKRSSGRNGARRRTKRKIIPIHISKFEDVLKELWNFFKGMDVGRRIEFFTFLDRKNFVPQFMALMYLYYDGKIDLYQEEPFGDITVEVLETAV